MRPHEDHAGAASSALIAGPRILLTATLRWPLAGRLAMAFAAQGCHVELLCPRGHPARTTAAVRRIHRAAAWRPLRALRRAIAAAAPDLILACDDAAALQLSQLHAGTRGDAADDVALRARILCSLGRPEASALATVRAELLALAAGEGVRVPATAALPSMHGLTDWLALHRLPAVLKLDASWGGDGVAVVHEMTQARRVFARLAAPPSVAGALVRALLDRDATGLAAALRGTARVVNVQAHVDGMPANRAVACWQGQVLAGISVQALHTQHLTGPATVVRVIDHPEMAQAAERMVRRLGVSGLWGLDFMLDAETGAAYLIEMNPRATPVCHLPLGAGRDLPAALVARWRGADAAAQVQPRPAIAGEVVALFPGEWLRDPASLHLRNAYHDRPDDEPRFVRDCIALPWVERGWVARAWAALRRAIVRQRTDAQAGRAVKACPAPGPGTRTATVVAAQRPRGATDARR